MHVTFMDYNKRLRFICSVVSPFHLWSAWYHYIIISYNAEGYFYREISVSEHLMLIWEKTIFQTVSFEPHLNILFLSLPMVDGMKTIFFLYGRRSLFTPGKGSPKSVCNVLSSCLFVLSK